MFISKDLENLKITNDYVFKRIFGHIGNEEIAKGLITSITNLKITNVNLDGNKILEKDLYDDKVGILDVKAKLDNEIVTNVEMQVIDKNNIEKRLLFYWSKLYSSQLKEGEKYNLLNKTIAILIADFELKNLNEITKYHTKWQIREEEYQKKVLTEILELHILELPKARKHIKNILVEDNKEKSKLNMWMKFITNPQEIKESELKMNKELRLAQKEYEKKNKDEYERRIAWLREKHLHDIASIRSDGYEDGIEEGKKLLKKEKDEYEKEIARLREKHLHDIASIRSDGIEEGQKSGIKQGKIEIAQKLLKKKLPIEEIIEITGLTKEEIEKLEN